ncbi:MAG: hypothetical protein JO152_07390, partial [Mycobacteriaceae bacterium]|nr:hypothetical protein [Mycobacteriaceae bacterium]
ANPAGKRVAGVLGGGFAIALTAIAVLLTGFGDRAPAPPPRAALPAAPISTSGSASGVPPPTEQDQSIPYAASANCPAGSTSAQALTDTATDSAWVCVRGGQGTAVDGQVLHIDLDKSYVLTAVSVTPGWVAKTPGGKEEWLQHRVVSRLQYIFNDTDRTIVTQDTGNTHGPVTVPLKRILASRVTVIVLQTARPRADPIPTTGPGTGGLLDSMLGAAGAPLAPDVTQTTEPVPTGEADGEPVDSTFALSALKLLGHPPN